MRSRAGNPFDRSSLFGIFSTVCLTCPNRNELPRFASTEFQNAMTSYATGSLGSSDADMMTIDGINFQGRERSGPSESVGRDRASTGGSCAKQSLERPRMRPARPHAKTLRFIAACGIGYYVPLQHRRTKSTCGGNLMARIDRRNVRAAPISANGYFGALV